MLCGSLSSPQFGHSWNFVGVSAWWLRRMLRFDGEVFLLGTAIAAPLKSKKIATICAMSQRGRPRGGGRIVANRRTYSAWSRRCKADLGPARSRGWLAGLILIPAADAPRPRTALARHSQGGIADVGIGAALVAEGRGWPVARNEGGLVAHR